MSVYATSGTRFLVKLDDFNGRVGRVGFVPQNYVEAFQAGQKVDEAQIMMDAKLTCLWHWT